MFRQQLETIEQTRDRMILREKPHSVIGFLFFLLFLLPIAFGVHKRTRGEILILIPYWLWFLFLAVRASVDSTFCINRDSSTFRIRRKLWWLILEKPYSLNEVSKFIEWQSRKGNGLKMELRSGKKKWLTLSAEFISLDAQAGALNHFLHVARRHATNPPPAIHSSTNRILSENT